jgi:tetratricopeptide (TPR) repeat protein/class 3 adenylate cyclase/TolB-like protein
LTFKHKGLIIWRLKDNSASDPAGALWPGVSRYYQLFLVLNALKRMAIENSQNIIMQDSITSSPDSSVPVEQANSNERPSPVLGEGSEAESANVLFIDIVGFTNLSVNQQRQALKQLLQAVRSTDEFKRASAADQILGLPTGDGMALVFLNTTPVEPTCCAKNISRALRSGKQLFGVRMGVHSGPVYRDQDIDDKLNVTGDGINLAQRVMSCGDDGHILLSSSAVEFLTSFDDWAEQIHDLGEAKVRHGRQVHIFNLCGPGFGNPSLPKIVRAQRRRRFSVMGGVAILGTVLLLAAFLIYYQQSSAGTPKIDSVAIFPFIVVDDSNDQKLQDAAEDIALHIRNDLVDVSNLTVKPAPDSLGRYRGKVIDAIAEGQSLDVQAVLKGTIIKQGDGAMIEISLTNVKTNSHIWSYRYPYSTNATRQISEDIIPRLSRKEISAEEHAKLDKNYTSNATASSLYNEGRRYFIQRKMGQSIEQFRKAIEQDPNYAPAHAGLANALSLSPGYDIMRPEEAYPAAKEEVRKALEIDNMNVEAHYTSGYIRANYDWDWENARKDFERALELSKSHDADALYYYAFNYLIPMKRMDEAIRTMQTALGLDANSPIINTNLGWTYYYAGRDREAFEQYRLTLGKYPDFSRIHRRLQEYYEKNRDYPAALAEYEKINAEDKKVLEESWNRQGERGYWERRLGQLEEKATGGGYVPLYDKAVIYTNLGRTEDALALLEGAVKERSEGLIKVNVNPVFQNLRSNQRFIKVVQGLRLPS